MKHSITPVLVRCPDCGSEAGDPYCYTDDDEPTGYHATRRAAAQELANQRREQSRRARAARAAKRLAEEAAAQRIAELEREIQLLRAVLAKVATAVGSLKRPAGAGEEEQ